MSSVLPPPIINQGLFFGIEDEPSSSAPCGCGRGSEAYCPLSGGQQADLPAERSGRRLPSASRSAVTALLGSAWPEGQQDGTKSGKGGKAPLTGEHGIASRLSATLHRGSSNPHEATPHGGKGPKRLPGRRGLSALWGIA